MYAIRIGNETGLRTNTALREYARAEYGNEDIAWFLASASRRARPSRPSLRARILGSKKPRPHVALPHKGTPRLPPPEDAAPA